MNKSYEVGLEGWVLGHYRLVGDRIQATEVEAKYLVMSGQLVEPGTLAKKTRKAPTSSK